MSKAPEARKTCSKKPVQTAAVLKTQPEALLNWQKNPGVSSPEREAHLKAWSQYSGVDPVSGTEFDNQKNVVHAPKAAGPIPARAKVESKPLDQVEKVQHVDPARHELLKSWGDYNSLNVINHLAVDNTQHAIHASNSKPANVPQGRIKPAAAEKMPEKERSEERKERLKDWAGRSGYNIISGAELATGHGHASSTRPANALPVRGKAEIQAPAGKVVHELMHTVSGNTEFMRALAAKAHKP